MKMNKNSYLFLQINSSYLFMNKLNKMNKLNENYLTKS